MRFVASILLLSVLSGCFDSPPNTEKSAQVVESMAAALTKKHTNIKHLPIEKYQKWRQKGRSHTLIDVRGERARKTSFIPESVSLATWKNWKKRKKKNGLLIFYGAIGTRAIETINTLSLSNQTYNLRGGILTWVHAGNPVVNHSGEEVKEVYFESQAWNMLPEGHRGVTP